MKNKYTYLVDCGNSLGDYILFENFATCYKAAFPKECIKIARSTDPLENPKKIVVNTDGMTIDLTLYRNKKIEIIEYDLFRFMKFLSSLDIYPSYYYIHPIHHKPKQFDIDSYIVLYLRNINKAKGKNISSLLAKEIIETLPLDKSIILIGNDDTLGIEIYPNVIDYKKRLTLEEIGWICQNCELFIGSDGGIVHLAAACKCKNMITFNYTDKKYFPLSKHKSIAFLRNENHKFLNHLKGII